MFEIHSPSHINNQIKLNLIDEGESERQNDHYKKKKLINYYDYLKLKEYFLTSQETWQKIKEENGQLNIILTSYQQEISKFKDYKQNIDKSFEIIQSKYNELYNENKLLKNNFKENANKFNDIINELNNKIKQYQSDIIEKNIQIEQLKNIKNELNKKNEELFKKKEIELLKKDEVIKNKEIEIRNIEKVLNKREIDIKEREVILKLEENKLKDNKKKDEEIYKKLKEEINLKERIINLDIDKINENKFLINETIEKLKEKESFFDKELNRIKKFSENIIQKNEINIEYRCNNQLNSLNTVEYIDKFAIIQNINFRTKKEDKDLQMININDNNNYTKLSLINNVLLDNYLNTINVGYNNLKDTINESLDGINYLDSECEPIPSFLFCLKKLKNN